MVEKKIIFHLFVKTKKVERKYRRSYEIRRKRRIRKKLRNINSELI